MSSVGYKDIVSARYGLSVSTPASKRASQTQLRSQDTQSAARSHRLENSGKIKLDKVSISEEARNIQSSNGENASQSYKRLQKYSY